MSWSAILSWNDGADSVVIGDGSIRNGINASANGIEGWYSTPAGKWTITERSTTDGAFVPDEADIIYAARTVTLSLFVEGSTRDEVVANHLALLEAAHHECTLRVADGSHDTFVTGFPTITSDGGTVSRTRDEVELTLECPDPRRLASDDTDGCHVVAATSGSSSVSVTVGGIAPCYPLVVVSGTMSSGFELYMTIEGTQYTTSYTYAVTSSTPVTLDFRNARATVNGSDYSRYLSSRGFEAIDPGDSATFRLTASAGSGTATVTCRDTYV